MIRRANERYHAAFTFRWETPNGVEITCSVPAEVLKHLIVELGARGWIPTLYADFLLLALGLEDK